MYHIVIIKKTIFLLISLIFNNLFISYQFQKIFPVHKAFALKNKQKRNIKNLLIYWHLLAMYFGYLLNIIHFKNNFHNSYCNITWLHDWQTGIPLKILTMQIRVLILNLFSCIISLQINRPIYSRRNYALDLHRSLEYSFLTYLLGVIFKLGHNQ